MLVFLTEFSTLNSTLKLVFLLALFVALLYLAQRFTKWYAKSEMTKSKTSNINVIEARQIAPGKNIIIAKVGGKYIALAVSKENVTFLLELNQEDIVEQHIDLEKKSFQDVLHATRKYNQESNLSFHISNWLKRKK